MGKVITENANAMSLFYRKNKAAREIMREARNALFALDSKAILSQCFWVDPESGREYLFIRVSTKKNTWDTIDQVVSYIHKARQLKFHLLIMPGCR